MTNEAVLLIQTAIPMKFTCSDTTGIEKGAILKLADPNTVSLANGVSDLIGGIAAQEKIANDGMTQIAVHREGVFKVTISGSVGVADPLMTDPLIVSNAVSTAISTSLSGSKIIGIALEAGDNTHTIRMELRPMIGPTL